MRSFSIASTALLGVVLLAPHAGAQDPAAKSATEPPKPEKRKFTSKLTLPLKDGFEAGELAGFWLPGDYGTGSHTPTAVTISDDFARSGRRSAKIIVRQGDVEAKGDDGKSVERAELDSGHYQLVGQEVWYGCSILLRKDFPIVDNRLVIVSWKQSDVEGSPLVGQRFRNGKHTITIRPPGASRSGANQPLPELTLGKWHDFVYRLKFWYEKDGAIEMWMNGKKAFDYHGPTASKSGADRFYHKVGLYRDRWKAPMTMYLDNYSVGRSFDEVDPAKFDARR